MPGTNANKPIAPDTVASTLGLDKSCFLICKSSAVPAALLVTTNPADVAINNAGI